jgi:hypothetical protein
MFSISSLSSTRTAVELSASSTKSSSAVARCFFAIVCALTVAAFTVSCSEPSLSVVSPAVVAASTRAASKCSQQHCRAGPFLAGG